MGTGKIIQADKIQGLADVPNFLSNPNGLLNTSGWTEGSYTAGSKPTGNFTASSGAGKFSISRTTTNPLGMTGTSLVFTKASGDQRGRAVETVFALPLDYRAKVLKLSASYINTSTNAADFVAGSDTTSSDMIFYTAYSTDGGTTYTVAEPSSFKLLSNSKDNSSPYDGSYQTPYNATHLKLIAYVATTSTTAWSIKAVLGVSPSQYVYGTPITDWQSYTPTITSVTGSITNYAQASYYRRVGDNIEVSGNLVFTGAPGTWTFPLISLPPGLSFDTNKLINVISEATLGFAKFYDATPTQTYQGLVRRTGSNQVVIESSLTQSATANSPIINSFSSNAIPFAFASSDRISWSFSAPILGWSSSVQMSDGYDARVVAANVYRLTSTPAQLIPNATYTGVGFDSKNFDTTSGWVTSATGGSSYFVVPSSGYYRISASVTFINNSAGRRILAVAVGNAASPILRLDSKEGLGGTLGLAGAGSFSANAGDKIFISVYQESGGSLNLSQFWNEAAIEKLSGSPTISASEELSLSYTNSAGSSFPTGTATTLTFPTKEYDTHGSFDGTSFRPNSSGRFRISMQLGFQSSSVNANTRIFVSIKKNGVEVSGIVSTYAQTTQTYVLTLTGSKTLNLLSTDVVTFAIDNNTGAQKDLLTSSLFNYLSIEKVK